MTAGKRRFRGPGGGVFVPHRTVDDVTIKTMVDAGEWTPEPDTRPAGDGGEVPGGTVADVMAWVGDDPDRARRALDAEAAKGDKARSTLVDSLTVVVEQ